jgi:diguanylate cyclase (GGDEF)-like protein
MPQDPGAARVSAEAEARRLAALDRYDVLDTGSEEAFDRITRLASRLVDVPIAHVSFLDAHRQWFKSAQGLDASEAPRQDTFCRHVIETGEPLVVGDAARDARFSDNPFVLGDTHLRAYAGVPLRTGDGEHIGTLCAVDTRPRDFTPEQVDLLRDLARIAVDELELRLQAPRDSLTGALSRRAFKEEAGRAVALALRHHNDLSCILFDLDRLKRTNDAGGSGAGDEVLRHASRIAAGELRQSDLVGRLGGDDFAVLLPNTAPGAALGVAEKLRTAISGMSIAAGPLGPTASFGVAGLDASTRDLDTLLAHAEEALAKAKAEGRNRCVLWHGAASNVVPQRRRVLKGGRILFNGRTSSIDCTVRSLSDDGAGIDIYSTVGIPRQFDLLIPADHLDRACRVVQQSEKHLDVAFT